MSMSEPFMPADEPRPEGPTTDRDIDNDVDVIWGSGDGDSEASAPVEFPANPTFRTPTPGDHLSEDALEKDLDEE